MSTRNDNQKPDNQKPGNQKPGSQEPGSQEPGSQEPGSQEPGDQQLSDSKASADEILDLAALYASGALTRAQRQAVDARITAGETTLAEAIASFHNTITQMTDGVPSVEPAPAIKAALLAEIRREAHTAVPTEPQPTEPQLTVARASEAQWIPLEIEGHAIEGAQMRLLSMDPAADRVTLLLRMQAGARFPAHVHAQTEDFYVLEGDMRWDDLTFGPGDYMHAEPGSMHPEHWSETGCLCLVTTSLANEYV